MRTGLQLLVEQARLWNLPATQPGELLASAPFIPVSEMGVWSFTPYVFCSFRCRYCCAQAQGLSRPIFDAEKLVETMRRELRAGRVASPIIVGLAADAYPPLEAELGLTRLAIRTLTEERTQFSIVTKGALIRRDIDLLAGNHFVQSVAVSISSHRDEDIQLHEPGAPSFGERSDAVFDLVKNGVPTQVHVVWIPGTTDVPAMARAFRGAAPVIVGPLNLDEDTHKPPGKRSSALRAYGHMWTQDEIDEAYLAEAESHFDAAVWGYPVKPRAPCFSLMSREDLHHFRRPATLAAPDAHP